MSAWDALPLYDRLKQIKNFEGKNEIRMIAVTLSSGSAGSGKDAAKTLAAVRTSTTTQTAPAPEITMIALHPAARQKMVTKFSRCSEVYEEQEEGHDLLQGQRRQATRGEGWEAVQRRNSRKILLRERCYCLQQQVGEGLLHGKS